MGIKIKQLPMLSPIHELFYYHQSFTTIFLQSGHEFVWHPVKATNATHLNIGNEMVMDMGLPNHERMNFWQTLPIYWNANRANFAPAPPIIYKDEL